MPAAAPAEVNPTPLIRVDAASVSLTAGGDYELLLRTAAGAGRFLVPLVTGAGIFRVTNPAARFEPKHGRVPLVPPARPIA